MRKLTAIIFILLLTLSMTACMKGVEKDYPAAIMVNGTVYLLSGAPSPIEIDESAVIGYTKSYIDTYPKKDFQSNFDRELNMPVAQTENSIAVLYQNEWHLCTAENK